MDFAQFFTQTHSNGNKSKSLAHTYAQLVLTKLNMGTHRLDNYQSSVFWAADRSHGSMCPDSAETNDRLARVSADQFQLINV